MKFKETVNEGKEYLSNLRVVEKEKQELMASVKLFREQSHAQNSSHRQLEDTLHERKELLVAAENVKINLLHQLTQSKTENDHLQANILKLQGVFGHLFFYFIIIFSFRYIFVFSCIHYDL